MTNLLLLFILLSPIEDPTPPCPMPIWQYDRGRMSLYDPALGGINCNGDCTTVAMGYFHEDMYKVAGACHPALYGATVYFPYLDQEFHCVDNMGIDALVYSPWHLTCVPYFDVLWPLHEEPAPEWVMWSFGWEVVEWGGAWNWYQSEIAPQFEEGSE